jgi:hypothetical protein
LRVLSRVAAVRPGAVDVAPLFGGPAETFAADSLIWVSIRPGQTALAGALEARGIAAVRIGDALAGRNLQTAIREGHLAARSLPALEIAAPASGPRAAA